MAEVTNEELKELLEKLTIRVTAVENELNQLKSTQEIPEEVLIAIGAAVSAYLGNKAKPHAVRYSGTRWAQAARGRIQDRRVHYLR